MDTTTTTKIKLKPLKNRINAGIIAAIATFGAISSSHAAIAVTWAGGNGTPLSVTFYDPVEFKITADLTNGTGMFVMQGLGLFTSYQNVSGLTYSINGGADLSVLTANSGWTGVDVTMFDTYFFGAATFANTPVKGDILILHPGTLIWSQNYAGPAPANGNISMIYTDGVGGQVGVGTAVPEVSSSLLCGLGMLGLLRRRR